MHTKTFVEIGRTNFRSPNIPRNSRACTCLCYCMWEGSVITPHSNIRASLTFLFATDGLRCNRGDSLQRRTRLRLKRAPHAIPQRSKHFPHLLIFPTRYPKYRKVPKSNSRSLGHSSLGEGHRNAGRHRQDAKAGYGTSYGAFDSWYAVLPSVYGPAYLH